MLKKIVVILMAGVFTLNAAENFTGEIYPVPQQISQTFIPIPVAAESFIFQLAPGCAAFKETFDFCAGRFREIPLPVTPDAGKVIIDFAQSAELPPGGYSFSVSPVPDCANITVQGRFADKRGLVYAFSSLKQMLKNSADDAAMVYLDIPAKITDYPAYQGRYASDIAAKTNFESFVFLADNKISGVAVRTDGMWLKPEWRRENAELFSAITKAAALGLADTIAELHIFPKYNSKPVNLASEADINMVIEAGRDYARSGVKMLMVAVDDLTPREGALFTYHTEAEKKKFGPNAGRGHGYIMKRLYEALHPEFPELEFSMVVAPYATELHGIFVPEVAEYFTQWAEEAPEPVALVWTGKYVFSPDIKAEETKQLQQLLKGHSVFIFSNSNGIGAPMPRWRSRLYDGMGEISGGRVLLWGSIFSRPLEQIYYLTANDYLWNPGSYDPESSYLAAAGAIFGRQAAGTLNDLQKAFQQMLSRKSSGSREGFAECLDNFKSVLKQAHELRSFTDTALPLTQLESELKSAEDYLNYQYPVVHVGKEQGKFTLTNRDNSPDANPVQGSLENTGKSLKFKFFVPSEQVPDQAETPHDSYVFLHPDHLEIFLQPTPEAPEWLNTEPTDIGYAHFCLDTAGNRFDEPGCAGFYRYNPEWSAKTAKVPGGWSAEVEIPFESLKFFKFTQPAPGVVWRMNLQRVNAQTNQVQSWSKGGTDGEIAFHAPEWFGEIIFED